MTTTWSQSRFQPFETATSAKSPAVLTSILIGMRTQWNDTFDLLHRLTAACDPNAIMATGDLRKDLGISSLEKQRRLEIQEFDRTKTNQNFQHWNKALEAFALGWRKPKSRHPVIISPDSLISTPEKLQELAGMAETPRVINTTYATMRGVPDDSHLQADCKPEEVQIGEVSWRELTEIKRKTECEDFLFVLLDGKIRHTVMVKSLKANNNAPEQQNHNKNQDDQPGMSPSEVQTL